MLRGLGNGEDVVPVLKSLATMEDQQWQRDALVAGFFIRGRMGSIHSLEGRQPV
jgi:hypothetical protein